MILTALTAASPVEIKAVGVSPAGWITAIVGLFGSIIGAGGVYGIFKGLALLHEQRNNRAKMDTDGAAVIRKEMMEFNRDLQKRVEGLEETGRQDRKRFDDELVSTRRAHAEEVISIRNGYENEIRSLRDEIAGLRRQMAQWANTSQAAIELSKNAPTATKARIDNSGIGDVLRDAFEVPGTDGEV